MSKCCHPYRRDGVVIPKRTACLWHKRFDHRRPSPKRTISSDNLQPFKEACNGQSNLLDPFLTSPLLPILKMFLFDRLHEEGWLSCTVERLGQLTSWIMVAWFGIQLSKVHPVDQRICFESAYIDERVVLFLYPLKISK